MSDISKHLGQIVKYESTYNAGLLVKELRETNRTEQGITSPFVGSDVWNIYEVSFLTDNGLPVNGIGKLVYPSSSHHIVESKSLKLYFFSLNMEKLGATRESAIEKLQTQVVADLTALLDTNIYFEFTPTYSSINAYDPFVGYQSLDNLDYSDMVFDKFNEDAALLVADNAAGTLQVTTANFRSNCKVTSQPDLADIYVYIKGDKLVDKHSLMRYLVSFRNENHFHEECVETIYDRLYKLLAPKELLVCGRFTRRGGIDINPIRANNLDVLLPESAFMDADSILVKTLRQ
jgi:7-cyano-7-deazaguanine reductase